MNKITATQERQMKKLCKILEEFLCSSDLPDKEKTDLMNHIEKLQFALETIIINNPGKLANEMKQASKHLRKKMQSSFSD